MFAREGVGHVPVVAVHIVQSTGITKLDGEAQGSSDQSIRGVGSSAVVGLLRAGTTPVHGPSRMAE